MLSAWLRHEWWNNKRSRIYSLELDQKQSSGTWGHSHNVEQSLTMEWFAPNAMRTVLEFLHKFTSQILFTITSTFLTTYSETTVIKWFFCTTAMDEDLISYSRNGQKLRISSRVHMEAFSITKTSIHNSRIATIKEPEHCCIQTDYNQSFLDACQVYSNRQRLIRDHFVTWDCMLQYSYRTYFREMHVPLLPGGTWYHILMYLNESILH
jgi:hypothetical protein